MKVSGIVARLCFASLLLAGAGTVSQAAWTTIHNDFFQIDQNGNAVATRSGCLQKFGNIWYWYGCTSNFLDQTCYYSTDLMHWTYKGVVYHCTTATNRMDVVYNDSTKQYLMMMKFNGGSLADLGIATSATPDGQYSLKVDSLVFGYKIGDCSTWKDDDGKAYFLYVWDSVPNANSGDKSTHALASFSPDYMKLQSKLWMWDTGSREAPCMMKNNGIYYYITSLTLWTQSTASQYYTATNPAGPWTKKRIPIRTTGSTNSWDTQCDFVVPIKGTQGTVFMYGGDRWVKPNDSRQGDYAWLPITFAHDTLVMNYYQDWEIDVDAGIWRPFDPSRNLALHKTAVASSESGSNVASKVTDSMGYSNFASSRWSSAASDTQWIRVDLGSPMSVNRVILKWDSCYAKSFDVQVSTDTTNWNTVYSTTAGGRRSVTDQTFPTATARYVRVYATKRGTTLGYGMFDFMVLYDGPTAAKAAKSQLPSGSLLTCRNGTVHYAVPSGNQVKLEILDCRGKLAAVLAEGFKSAGAYEAALPGTLGRGVYVVRLTTGARTVAVTQVKL